MRTKKHPLANIAGWYGVIAILAAYALLTLGVLSPQHLAYHILNLTGALGIIASSTVTRDWQADTLNVVFGLIAAFGIASVFLR